MTSQSPQTIPMLPRSHRYAYKRGLEIGYRMAEQATQRVRWTISVKARDSLVLGLAIGLLVGALGEWVVRL